MPLGKRLVLVKIQQLLDEVKQKMQAGKPFPFHDYLNRLEELLPAVKENMQGKVEENVIVDGTLVLGKGSVVKPFSCIEGTVIIGENCKIGPFAYLRNGTVIGNNSRVGRSEIKNSIVLDNTNIAHFSYVGDSIIGDNVNLGAGTKIANLRFDGKNVKIKSPQEVDTGRRKLGVLIFNNTKTGINVSINCGAIISANSRIPPGEFVKGNYP